MNPVLLQKQLKENASDLSEFYKELKAWGDDMKRKDESLARPQKPTQNSKKQKKVYDGEKIKQVGGDSKVVGKIGSTDYSAWDKFDADAECEKVDYDENDESSLTDEYDESGRDQAILEKEKGNKLVKEQKWNEAIKCYTKAIKCYSYDPIFFANRALCFLNTQNITEAENDCIMSLKLDNTYVKAYQRRAAAREALNKLEEAEADLLQVLKLEPKNNQSRKALDDLRKKLERLKKPPVEQQRPISKFAASRSAKNSMPNTMQKIADTSIPSRQWSDDNSGIMLVKSVQKPPHLRSKKPLKRIQIHETSDIADDNNLPIKNKVVEKSPILQANSACTPKTNEPATMTKDNKNCCNSVKAAGNDAIDLITPKTSVQFYLCWKQLRSAELKYKYLKLLEPKDIPAVFKESLDTSIFSDILTVLAEFFVKNNDRVFEFLSCLTLVRRFSTFTMFLTSKDKNNLWRLIDYVKDREDRTGEEVDLLIKKYEL